MASPTDKSKSSGDEGRRRKADDRERQDADPQTPASFPRGSGRDPENGADGDDFGLGSLFGGDAEPRGPVEVEDETVDVPAVDPATYARADGDEQPQPATPSQPAPEEAAATASAAGSGDDQPAPVEPAAADGAGAGAGNGAPPPTAVSDSGSGSDADSAADGDDAPAASGDGTPTPRELAEQRAEERRAAKAERKEARRQRKEARPRMRKLRFIAVLVFLGALGAVSWVFGVMMAVAVDLPDLEARAQYERAQNSVVSDRDGHKLVTLTGNEHRILLESDEIAPVVKQAVVAIEDERFYEHRGIDYVGLARALQQDILAGGAVQGGSTITQQFVKTALEAQQDRTVLEKLKEAAPRAPRKIRTAMKRSFRIRGRASLRWRRACLRSAFALRRSSARCSASSRGVGVPSAAGSSPSLPSPEA